MSKNVKPPTSARANEAARFSAEQEAELDVMRQRAKQHEMTGALVIKPDEVLPVEQIAAHILIGAPLEEVPPADPGDPAPKDVPKWKYHSQVKIELLDGRTVSLAPPDLAFEMLMPLILKGKTAGPTNPAGWDNNDVMIYIETARVAQYVRAINGRPVKLPLRTWDEVAGVMHELKSIGSDAVRDAVLVYWPSSGPRLWLEAKN